MIGAGWTAADLARLAKLWGEGLSTTAIGRAMGRSKNSVVGKAHRLNLPARPSPIAAKGSGANPKQRRRVTGPTLAPLASAVQAAPMPSVEVAPVAATAAPRYAGVSRPCCWPIGEPRTKGFRYCDGPGVPGRPYCDEHCGLAYVQQAVRSAAQLAADEARRAAAHARMAPGGGFAGAGFTPELGG